MRKSAQNPSNLELLESFWRRRSFHDMEIEDVTAVNRRVIIRLNELTLVVTNTIELKRCELPAVWLDQSVVQNSGNYRLEIKTDTGRISVTGTDFRLVRNGDLAVLIPPVDA